MKQNDFIIYFLIKLEPESVEDTRTYYVFFISSLVNHLSIFIMKPKYRQRPYSGASEFVSQCSDNFGCEIYVILFTSF